MPCSISSNNNNNYNDKQANIITIIIIIIIIIIFACLCFKKSFLIKNYNDFNNNLFFTEYCWENPPKLTAVRQSNCYSKNDSCPPGLKDCSDEFVCPLSTNKCCCSSSVPPSVSTAPPSPKPSLYHLCQFVYYIDSARARSKALVNILIVYSNKKWNSVMLKRQQQWERQKNERSN